MQLGEVQQTMISAEPGIDSRLAHYFKEIDARPQVRILLFIVAWNLRACRAVNDDSVCNWTGSKMICERV